MQARMGAGRGSVFPGGSAECRRLERALERERMVVRRLEHLRQVKDLHLLALSHDLMNPLSAIVGLSTIIESGGAPEASGALAERISRNARKMRRILQDLLDLDRLRESRDGLCRSEVAIGRLVRGVIADADIQDRSVEVSIEPESLTASVDAVMVERILDNLIGDAVKHTPPRTPIWVRARRRGRALLLVVEDAGPGVSEDMRGRVFEPFVRGEADRADGLGLGLHIVERFTVLHGGRVWVGERAGGGASFSVLLPDAAYGPNRPRSPQRGVRAAASDVAMTR